MALRSLKNLWRGILGHSLKTLGYIFTAFSVSFTTVQGITYFVPGVKIEGKLALGGALAISIAYGLRRIWKPSKVEIAVAHTNTTIEVLFGDIFAQTGVRAIAVSDFFESKLGKPVSEHSLHGIFLKRCFGGHPESFDKQLEEQLHDSKGEQTSKSEGKSKCYPIGTTALVTVDKDRYLHFALTKGDPQTCKVSTDVTMMWVALSGLWARARIECGGESLNVPLVGSGVSGLNLPTRDLLNLIILSAITETKVQQITQKIRIVLHTDKFEALDLREVQTYWEVN
jgi:hypothetical protein